MGRVWIDIALLFIIVGGMALFHLAVGGRVPSGPDGGKWLALAQESRGMFTTPSDVRYPPVFIHLLGFLLGVFEPIPALNAAAFMSKAVLLVVVYWIARPLGRTAALLAAGTLGLAGYQLEAFARGGYPQMLGIGIGLMSSFVCVRYVLGGRRAHLVVGLLLSALTFLTHELAGVLLVAAIPIATVLVVALGQPRVDTRGSTLLATIGLILVAAPFLYSMFDSRAGAEPVINPLDLTRAFSVRATIWEAPVPWFVLAAIALIPFFTSKLAARLRVPTAVGSAWAITGVGFFVFSGEQRALLVAQLGIVLAATAAFMALWWAANQSRQNKRRWKNALIVIGLAMVGSLGVSGVDAFVAATEWYRVVGPSEIQTLEDLQSITRPGNVIVASRGPRGNQIGWWVQGIALRPTYTAVDVRFLAYPEERRQANLANRLFSGELSPSATMELLGTINASLIVVDKRGPDRGWIVEGQEMGFEVAAESGSLVVFRVN